MLTADEILKELLELEAKHNEKSAANGNGEGSARTQQSAALPYWLNDLYHALRIKTLYGDDVRYCRKLGGFLIWHGTHWGPDKDFTMWRWAAEATHDIWREAKELPDEDTARRAYTKKWAKRAERRRHIEDAFMHLRALEGIVVEPDVFDWDPWLFNVKNGTIDLRAGELLEHRREDFITHCAPVEFHPDAEPPARWLQFLSEIFDGNRDIIDFVQRACGYALTGSVSEQKLFFLHGSTGKTTFLDALMHVMGSHAVRLPSNLLSSLRRGLQGHVLAGLRGCRLACIADVESDGKLAPAAVKQLTGRNRLSARRKWGDSFGFEPSHTLFICGSHLPAIRATGSGIWRRILLIPFNVIIPDEEQDKELPAKLCAEATGILDWLVKGCLEWQKHGLAPPTEITEATGSYRNDMDPLGDFLDDCCYADPDGETPNPELRKAYEKWCERNDQRPLSATALTLRLKERGFVQKPMGHSRTRTWLGFALDPFEGELDEETACQIEKILETIKEDQLRRENRDKM